MYKCTSISCLFSYINSCFASFRSKLYLTKLLSYRISSNPVVTKLLNLHLEFRNL